MPVTVVQSKIVDTGLTDTNQDFVLATPTTAGNTLIILLISQGSNRTFTFTSAVDGAFTTILDLATTSLSSRLYKLTNISGEQTTFTSTVDGGLLSKRIFVVCEISGMSGVTRTGQADTDTTDVDSLDHPCTATSIDIPAGSFCIAGGRLHAGGGTVTKDAIFSNGQAFTYGNPSDGFIQWGEIAAEQLAQFAPYTGTTARQHVNTMIVFEPTGGAATYTASAALTLGGISFSGSATHAAPNYAATAALTLGGAEFVALASFVGHTATAALTLGGVEFAGSGSFTPDEYSATAALTLGAVGFSGSATFAPPVYDATAVLVMAGVAFAGSGTFAAPRSKGTAWLTLGGIDFAASDSGSGLMIYYYTHLLLGA